MVGLFYLHYTATFINTIFRLLVINRIHKNKHSPSPTTYDWKFHRSKSFLWIKTKTCVDEIDGWPDIGFWQWLDGRTYISLGIRIHHFITKPFFRKLIFKDSTHGGDLLGKIPFCEEGRASCEEVESLQSKK